jgi:hypothetical protein
LQAGDDGDAAGMCLKDAYRRSHRMLFAIRNVFWSSADNFFGRSGSDTSKPPQKRSGSDPSSNLFGSRTGIQRPWQRRPASPSDRVEWRHVSFSPSALERYIASRPLET